MFTQIGSGVLLAAMCVIFMEIAVQIGGLPKFNSCTEYIAHLINSACLIAAALLIFVAHGVYRSDSRPIFVFAPVSLLALVEALVLPLLRSPCRHWRVVLAGVQRAFNGSAAQAHAADMTLGCALAYRTTSALGAMLIPLYAILLYRVLRESKLPRHHTD